VQPGPEPGWETDRVSHPHASTPQADASVRTARTNDAPAVGLVQAFVWQAEYADILDPDVLEALTGPRFGAVWRQSLEHPPTPRHRLLVACAGPQVVGYVALGPAEDEPGLPPGTTGMILDGGVHPEGRRDGHGSRLLNAAVDTLRAGADDLEAVGTWVLADAGSTRAFLQTAGFEPDGAWRDRVVAEDGRTAREVRLVAWTAA
jgi:GNAT superfamily N-acetyltransferase